MGNKKKRQPAKSTLREQADWSTRLPALPLGVYDKKSMVCLYVSMYSKSHSTSVLTYINEPACLLGFKFVFLHAVIIPPHKWEFKGESRNRQSYSKKDVAAKANSYIELRLFRNKLVLFCFVFFACFLNTVDQNSVWTIKIKSSFCSFMSYSGKHSDCSSSQMNCSSISPKNLMLKSDFGLILPENEECARMDQAPIIQTLQLQAWSLS